jgi:3-oxoacyl-[acyl-carrier protein] reductase
VTEPVAIVTGASRGIGAALAARLAVAGYVVIGVARSSVDEWDASTGGVDRRQCDVGDESAVKRLFSTVRKEHGRLDLTVNGAGMFSGDLLLTATGDRYSAVLRANLVGVHLTTRESVKLMRGSGRGRVITLSSIASEIAVLGNALYGTSKWAVERLMRDFALEFRGSGITFNSVAISFVEQTGMVEALRPEARALYEQRLLVPRPLGLDELEATIAYLSSDGAATVTGQVIALGSPF